MPSLAATCLLRTRTRPKLGLAMIFAGIIAAVAGACSEAPRAKPDAKVAARPTGSAITYNDVAKVLNKSCVEGCHIIKGTAAGTPYNDLRRLRVARPDIYMRLISNDPALVMPPNDMGFKTSRDGSFIIDWIREGADIITDDNGIVSTGGTTKGKAGTTTKVPPKPSGKAGGVPTLDARLYADVDYAGVEAKITKACGTCHGAAATGANDGYTRWPLEALADFRGSNRNAILSALEQGKEPRGAGVAGTAPDDLKWINSADGKAIYGWLKHGRDFQSGN